MVKTELESMVTRFYKKYTDSQKHLYTDSEKQLYTLGDINGDFKITARENLTVKDVLRCENLTLGKKELVVTSNSPTFPVKGVRFKLDKAQIDIKDTNTRNIIKTICANMLYVEIDSYNKLTEIFKEIDEIITNKKIRTLESEKIRQHVLIIDADNTEYTLVDMSRYEIVVYMSSYEV